MPSKLETRVKVAAASRIHGTNLVVLARREPEYVPMEPLTAKDWAIAVGAALLMLSGFLGLCWVGALLSRIV